MRSWKGRCSGATTRGFFRNKRKRESWESDFRGKILLQDGISYFVGVTRRTTFAGEEYLALYLRPDLRLPVGVPKLPLKG